jgi:hypothetical protein
MPVDKIKMKMNNSVTRDVYEVIRKIAKEYPYKVDVVFDEEIKSDKIEDIIPQLSKEI